MTEAARFRRTLAGLGLAAALLFLASLLIGPAGLPPGASLDALLTGRGEATTLVMREIRLPRATLALLIGGGLGLSGGSPGLPSQPARRAGADRRVRIRCARGGARPLHRPVGGLPARPAADGARGRLRRDPARPGACGRRLVLEHPDPRRPRRFELRQRAHSARAQPRAQPVRRLRDRALAARLTRRPLAAAARARRAIHPRRLRAATRARSRARCAHPGRGRRGVARRLAAPHPRPRRRRHGARRRRRGGGRGGHRLRRPDHAARPAPADRPSPVAAAAGLGARRRGAPSRR